MSWRYTADLEGYDIKINDDGGDRARYFVIHGDRLIHDSCADNLQQAIRESIAWVHYDIELNKNGNCFGVTLWKLNDIFGRR
jgi:hypothetical protein